MPKALRSSTPLWWVGLTTETQLWSLTSLQFVRTVFRCYLLWYPAS